MRRLRRLEQAVAQMGTARSLESSSIGAGGLRIRGGQIRVQDIAGDDMFRAGGDPGEVFIRDDVLGPFAVSILASRIFVDTVVTSEILSADITFGDLPSFGPSVTCEIISGVALAFVGVRIEGIVNTGIDAIGGYAGIQVSGATSIPASTTTSAAKAFTNVDSGGQAHGATDRFANIVPLLGLNPGEHTFTMKYRNFSVAADAVFSARTLAVIAL
jgi:hypothetical protein